MNEDKKAILIKNESYKLVNQIRKVEYQFNNACIRCDSDGSPISDKVMEDYKLAMAYKSYFDSFYGAGAYHLCELINKNKYRNDKRLKHKIEMMLEMAPYLNARVYFLTLTFSDIYLNNTKENTRRQKVYRFLKKYCSYYIANIDYGKEKGREHYHAIVFLSDNEKIALDYWKKKVGFVSIEKVQINNTSPLKIAKYINKLTLHAIKETAKNNKVIFGNNYNELYKAYRYKKAQIEGAQGIFDPNDIEVTF